MAVIDITGKRYGRLIVASIGEPLRDGKGWVLQSQWNCVCDCGKTKLIRKSSLSTGSTTSCGCAQREAVSTHGLESHPLYSTWRNMHFRCYNPKSKDFKNYSSRGIKVCDRWHDIRNFVADVPPKPEGKFSFDREDNNKWYQPGNVRWATSKQQSLNTCRNIWIEIDGSKMTLSQWSEFLNVSKNTISEYAKRNKLTLDVVIRKRLSQ